MKHTRLGILLAVLMGLVLSACGTDSEAKIEGVNQHDIRQATSLNTEPTTALDDTLTLNAPTDLTGTLAILRDNVLYLADFGGNTTLIAEQVLSLEAAPNNTLLAYVAQEDTEQVVYSYDIATHTAQEWYRYANPADQVVTLDGWSPDSQAFIVRVDFIDTSTAPNPNDFLVVNADVRQFVVHLSAGLLALPEAEGYTVGSTNWALQASWLVDNTLLVGNMDFYNFSGVYVWHFDPSTLTTTDFPMTANNNWRFRQAFFGDEDANRRDIEIVINPLEYYLAPRTTTDLGNTVFSDDMGYSVEVAYEQQSSGLCSRFRLVQKPIRDVFVPTDIYSGAAIYISPLLLTTQEGNVVFVRLYAPSCDDNQQKIEVIKVVNQTPVTLYETGDVGSGLAFVPQMIASPDRRYIMWTNKSDQNTRTSLMLTDIENGTTNEVLAVPYDSAAGTQGLIQQVVWLN